jgi:hypothetical protein
MDQMKLNINGGFHSYVVDATEALGNILEQNMANLHYMSCDGIINYMLEAMLLVEETITEWGNKDTSLKKRITQLRKGIEAVKDRDRTTLMNFYTNMMLGCAGMATLSGYGMCTTKSSKGRIKMAGKIWLNPEKKSACI